MARKIDERLEHFRSSGGGALKIEHATLVEQFQADLHSRANAGEIDVRTVRRYESALKHYLEFVEHRKFLLGQSPGRSAIATYTHLNEIHQRFEVAVAENLRPLVDAIVRRARTLGPISLNQGTEA